MNLKKQTEDLRELATEGIDPVPAALLVLAAAVDRATVALGGAAALAANGIASPADVAETKTAVVEAIIQASEED